MANLLSAAAQINKLIQGMVAFFKNFQIIYGVEIFLFFALIFFVSKILRDNESTRLMILYWVLILVGGALRVFDEELMKFAMGNCITLEDTNASTWRPNKSEYLKPCCFKTVLTSLRFSSSTRR